MWRWRRREQRPSTSFPGRFCKSRSRLPLNARAAKKFRETSTKRKKFRESERFLDGEGVAREQQLLACARVLSLASNSVACKQQHFPSETTNFSSENEQKPGLYKRTTDARKPQFELDRTIDPCGFLHPHQPKTVLFRGRFYNPISPTSRVCSIRHTFLSTKNN
jgi:hypothetical protein